MPYCTIVEFEWSADCSRQDVEALVFKSGPSSEEVVGRMSRIGGIDDSGAWMIEVWRSPEDAQAFAEKSSSQLGGTRFPMPARIVSFETSILDI